jgi:hypothetical protein
MSLYVANKEIHDMMEQLIRDYHHDLLPIMDQIVIVFREKAAKSGGKTVYGKSKKASPIISVLGEKEYKFIIELAADCWENELAADQRLALLDHHLCACRVDFDDKTGEYKCQVVPPDFIGFREEIDRHGIWRPQESNGDEGASVDELIGEG